MKKVTRYLFALLLGTTITMNVQAAEDPAKEVRQVLMEKMTLPETLKAQELDEDVQVKLSVQPNGSVEVLEVETENAELEAFVSETIGTLSLPENVVQDALTFSVRILFKVL